MERMMDVPYSRDDPDVCLLDIFRPEHDANGCCVFFIHGGGWTGGNKESWHPVMEHFCARGYACASLHYHLAPQWHFPKQFEDVRTAMSFVKSNAQEWGFSAEKVAAWGSSAGGYLAALLATTPPEDELGITSEIRLRDTTVAACVCLCTMFALHGYEKINPEIAKIIEGFLGTTEKENPELFRQASPMDRISGREPPFLMLVGDADRITPVDHHKAMAEALLSRGTVAKLIVLAGADHGFGYGVETLAQKETLEHAERFLAASLGLP